MKFSVDSKSLKEALSIAGRVVPGKSPWPIVLNVLIKADGDLITLRATDTDQTFETDIKADVTSPGGAIVPFATLMKFVSVAKGDTVLIEVSDHKAVIKSDRNRIALSAGEIQDFPDTAPAVDGTASLDVEAFSKALRFCVPAASEEEAKYHIKGVMIEAADGDLDFWATDGWIIKHAKMVGIADVGGNGQLPRECVATVLGILGEQTALRFGINESGWHAETGNRRAWGKVISARFLDARGLIQKMGEPVPVAFADREAFSKGIEIATCGTQKQARNVVIRAETGKPLILRGHPSESSAIHAGRAEVEAEVSDSVLANYSADLIRTAVSEMSADQLSLAKVEHLETSTLNVQPREQSAMLRLASVLMPLRTSGAELADV